MKQKIYALQPREIEIDDFDYEGDKYNITEEINEGLIDVSDSNFITEMKTIFNTQLDDLQLVDIEEFYFGQPGYPVTKTKTDSNFHIEFVIEYNGNYNEEDLLWLADELIDACCEDSTGVYGVTLNRKSKTIIDKKEDIN